jgi:hypothetical protein
MLPCMVLNGAHFTIGLWFDQPIFPSVVLAVGDALVAAGGRYEGDVTVVPSGAAFASSFDTDVYRTVDRRVVEGSAPGTVEGTVYRIGLRLPVVGEAEVTFARTPKKIPADEHPVEINMEADLVGFSYDHVDRKDRNRIKAKERAFLRQMKALCIALDPAYATMGEEITVAAPGELASGWGQLYSSAFVSHRLAGRPGLNARLAELAPLCKTRNWGTGTHFEWGPARREQQRDALWAANGAVSIAIGQALTSRSGR